MHPDNHFAAEAREILRRMGPRLLLLAHHYQRPEIVALAHRVGDSLELSRYAAEATQAEFIVFAGVRFMAEAASVLAAPHQRVFMPDPSAGCPMADMASEAQVEHALTHLASVLGEDPDRCILPLAYMNTSAAVKAVTGRHGGAICTSSNADGAMRWALGQRNKVLFLPDEHLGHNTALSLGIRPDELALYDPTALAGGLTDEEVRRARVFLWKGYCHVHAAFQPSHVEEARRTIPAARILVHPECRSSVVLRSDAAGSTSFLVRACTEAKASETLIIGTEINLVERMQAEHPHLVVRPLARSSCHDMDRTTLEKVTLLLRAIEANAPLEPITVPADVRAFARDALAKMLAFSS